MEKQLLDFIKYHKLSIDDFYDAKGLPVGHVKTQMKNSDKLFAYNTTTCNNAGHNVRSRNGGCIICDTS